MAEKICSNFYSLPHQIALAHDGAQASKLKELNEQVQGNNSLMRKHLYPILHEIESYINEGKDSYDLTKLEERSIAALNDDYQMYRKDLIQLEEGQDVVNAGELHQLFPEDLSEVSLHQLKKIQSKLQERLDHCKNFNNQSTQDLYLMLQIAVALHSAFQKAQEEMSNSAHYMIRKQVN